MTTVAAPFEIRRLVADDAEAFSALRRAVTADNPVQMGLSLEEELSRPMEGFRAQLSSPLPGAVFGAFVEGELAATDAVSRAGAFASSAHKMVMWGVFTSPPLRRRGLSRSVVQAALRHAFGSGVRRVNLLVYVPNEPALALYRSLGFVGYGTEREALHLNGASFDGVHMTLAAERFAGAAAGDGRVPAAHLPQHLETRRLALRRPTDADAGEIFRTYAQDPLVSRFMVWKPHSSEAETRTFVAGCTAAWEEGSRFAYVITESGTSSPIGMIEARVDRSTLDLGYVLARAHWGKGFMPEAVSALAALAFENGYFRVQAFCDVENRPSQRTLEKAGFAREGRLERYMIHPNLSPEPRPCFMYSRCR